MRLEDRELSGPMQAFVREIVFGVLTHRDMLDELIHQFAPDWPVEQMAVVDRNILRMAIYEIGARRDTPVKVAINEAIEIAKSFGSDSAPSFVNGVLGALASKTTEIAELLSMDTNAVSSSSNSPH